MSRCVNELKKYLSYNKSTGEFTWINRYCTRIKVGKRAGCLDKRGYTVIRFKKKLYYAHRLAWLFVHGEEPKTIDHINNNPTDNRIDNLRNVNQKINTLNKDTLNIWFRKDTNKWTGQVSKRSIGSYKTYEEAKRAFIKKREEFVDAALLNL